MSKSILVIAEKPSVGKTLAAWLSKKFGVTARSNGSHIVVGDYVVSWLFGHVLGNVEPDAYDPRYKKWNAADLPIVPTKWLLEPKADASAQIKALKGLLSSATGVLGLGDPDQEGQLLQDEFLLWAGCKVPVDRLWLSATDDASIEKAWKDIKPNSHYAGYYWSALARSHADWLAGMNLSRACTLASQANGGNAVLSVGRVQTPTLALVVAREKEIRAFKPVNYFTPFIELATKPGFKAAWRPDADKDTRLDPEGRLLDKKVADAIAKASLAAGSAVVTSVDSKKGSELPPLPFSLSSLQELMSRKHGMGVQDTLKYAQLLYEKKVASYPRTDSDYLPESQHSEAPTILTCLRSGIKSLGSAPGNANESLKSKAFNDKKVTAHHAIVPRPFALSQIRELSEQERLVWLEIAKRYLLQFFPAAEFLTSEIMLESAGEPFRATGKVFTKRGWKDAFASADEDDDDGADGALPSVKKGQSLSVANSGVDSTITKAPKRYTEGTLVAAMKSVHRFVSDAKLKSVLKDNVGIGTEATRGNTVGELFGRKFMTLEKKDIKPTDIGEALIDALPRQISAPDMTALWQQAMDDIKTTGEPGYAKFIEAQAKWLAMTVKDVPGWFAGKAMSIAGKKSGGSLQTKPTTEVCLTCGGALRHIKGVHGWFFGCTVEACKSVFKDVGGKPVAKAAAPSKSLTIGTSSSGDSCPVCKKGTLQARVCGPHTKSPGREFLACSNFAATGKAKCNHVIWPPR